MDGLQSLRVEPAVAVAEVWDVKDADLTVDDGELELAVERRGRDVVPFGSAESA
jgi:hypothetical protein